MIEDLRLIGCCHSSQGANVSGGKGREMNRRIVKSEKSMRGTCISCYGSMKEIELNNQLGQTAVVEMLGNCWKRNSELKLIE